MSLLDEDQLACVAHMDRVIQDGATLVVRAGAGSGKTHTMAHILARFPRALAISHTRIACHELEERVRRQSESAIPPFIRTIHALALSLASPELSQDPESGIDFDQMLKKGVLRLKDADARCRTNIKSSATS